MSQYHPARMPTMTAWRRFTDQLPTPASGLCVHCRVAVPFFSRGRITLSTRVKIIEDVVQTVVLYGRVYTDTVRKDRVMPVFVVGDGCPDCQHLMTKATADAKRWTEQDYAAQRGLKERRTRERRPAIDVTAEVLEAWDAVS